MQPYQVSLIILTILFIFTLTFCPKSAFNSIHDYAICMFLTGSHCEEAANAITSLRRVGMKERLIVICLDQTAYDCMGKLDVERHYMSDDVAFEATFGTKAFYNIMIDKIKAILFCMNHTNKNILYMDTDVVILKNIDKDLTKLRKDITFQCDNSQLTSKCTKVCAGFMYIINNNKTKKFFKNVLYHLVNARDKTYTKNGGADQYWINKLLPRSSLRWGTFPQKSYPNGAIYFDRSHQKNAKIIHNNYIVGTAAKIKRFKDNKLWFI